MGTLQEKLLAPNVRPQVVTDCAHLIDEEVSSKSGFSGLAIKGAFAVVKAVKSGIVPEVVDSLLPSFAEKLEPIYAAWVATPASPDGALPGYLEKRSGEVAEALLSITDERAKKSKNATFRKTYEKLRPSGKDHVEHAVPRLGKVLEKYAGTR
jgi:hypothetical protein